MAAELETRQRRATISQINVTPFVDVMLVLLVIFMVTAPIIQQGIQVNLPEAKAGAIQGKEDPLIVAVTQSGQIHLNDNPIDIAELGKKLRAIRQVQRDKQVYLRADQNVRYGIVMGVIATIKEAGIVKLGMITRPPSKGAS